MSKSSFPDWKIPTTEQIAEGRQGGWAPGDYLGSCLVCKCQHLADKRALYCYDHRFGATAEEKAAQKLLPMQLILLTLSDSDEIFWGQIISVKVNEQSPALTKCEFKFAEKTVDNIMPRRWVMHVGDASEIVWNNERSVWTYHVNKDNELYKVINELKTLYKDDPNFRWIKPRGSV